MRRKIGSLGICILLILSIFTAMDILFDFTPEVSGSTLYVNTTGSGGVYTSIQEAINNANNGDTVFVYSGTYYENLVVEKTINLTGEDMNTTIIDGGGDGNVVHINASLVKLSNFTIINSGSGGREAGIKVTSGQNTIYNNTITNNYSGIYLKDHGDENNISSNTIILNEISGIKLDNVFRNSISFNDIIQNNVGIHIYSSAHYTVVSNNDIHENEMYGIYLYNSRSCSITNNSFFKNGIIIFGSMIQFWNTHSIEDNTASGKPIYYYKDMDGVTVPNDAAEVILANCTNFTISNILTPGIGPGVELGFCSNNTIINNNISFSGAFAVFLYRSFYNIIQNNIVSNGDYQAITLYESSFNNISGNYIYSNERNGIYIHDSSTFNTVYGNNISMNNENGISMHYQSSNNSIIGNHISYNNLSGISIGTSDNEINENDIFGNNEAGIRVGHWRNNIRNNNIFLNNDYGIKMETAKNCTFSFNNIIKNENGIYPSYSENNSFHHNNFIENLFHVLSHGNYINIWDDGIGEGNFWDDYFGQDDGSNGRIAQDGVGDTNLPHKSMDNYPLMNTIDTGWSIHLPPTAFFTVTPSRGVPSILFTFNASECDDFLDSTSELQVCWDFDNDYVPDTDWNSEKIIEHQFSSAGNYVVRLWVMNSRGLISNSTGGVIVQSDYDGDAIPDSEDPDDDDDGYYDIDDAFPLNPLEWLDTDSDNIGDNEDTDDDNDTHPDDVDAYPKDPEKWKKSKEAGIFESNWTIILIILIIIGIVVLLIILKKRGPGTQEKSEFTGEGPSSKETEMPPPPPEAQDFISKEDIPPPPPPE
jgi:parallel beta-helix repeat protein